MMKIEGDKDVKMGNYAMKERGILHLLHPIAMDLEGKRVIDYECLKSLIVNTFESELRLKRGTKSIVLVEKAATKKEEREKMLEIVFENVQSPHCFIVNEAMMVKKKRMNE